MEFCINDETVETIFPLETAQEKTSAFPLGRALLTSSIDAIVQWEYQLKSWKHLLSHLFWRPGTKPESSSRPSACWRPGWYKEYSSQHSLIQQKKKKIKIMLTNSSTKLACFVFKVMETMVPVSGNGGFSKCVLSKIAKVEETEVHS